MTKKTTIRRCGATRRRRVAWNSTREERREERREKTRLSSFLLRVTRRKSTKSLTAFAWFRRPSRRSMHRSLWRALFCRVVASLERGRALPPRGATVKQRASCRGSLVRRTTPALGVPAVRRTRLTRQSVSRERHRVRASDLVSDCCATGESANSFLIDAARPRRACFRDDERPQGHQPRGGMGFHAGTSPRDPPILPRARFPPRRVARARFPRERK